MDKNLELLKKSLPKIQKNVSLKDHTTFKIGGPAEYFLIASEEKDIIKALEVSKKLKLPLLIFGGGSNLLVSDKGFKGLAVKIKKSKNCSLKNNVISAEAGIDMKDLVDFAADKSLSGLEWAGGLPGTFGGAIRGNAGAFGGEIKDSISEVRALDNNLKLRKFSAKQCRFSYRSSIFKKKNWTVVSAKIKLKKGDKEKIKSVAQSRIDYRNERHPLEYPNAGSIFKNTDFKNFPDNFKKNLLAVVKKDPFPVVPTAYLISEAGLKGLRWGNAEISKKHPNFIVNLGDASSKDVLKLINAAKKKIKKVYKINLETEVQMIGFRSK